MAIRKSTSDLTHAEINELVSAILKLKNEGNPKTGRNYDTYVEWHQKQAMPAHMSPQFLPWHRVFLHLMEKDLQDVSGNSDLSIPYWNWTDGKGRCSNIWESTFLGGNGDKFENWKVKDGPFAHENGNWEVSINDVNVNYLQRSFGEHTCELPSKRELDRLLKVPKYDSTPWNRSSDVNTSFRNRLEGWGIQSQLHNKVHVWIGGSMYEMTSPNDPVFFFHHCFIDMIWASWQNIYPKETYQTNSPDGINEKLPPMKNSSGKEFVVADCLDWKKLGFDYDMLFDIPAEKEMLISDEKLGFYNR